MYPAASSTGRNSGEKRLTAKNKIPEYLEPLEVEALIRATQDPGPRVMMLLQWRAGLRITEACEARIEDVTFGEYPTLRVRKGKGNKQRLVPLHPELRNALEILGQWRRTGYIVTHQRNVGDQDQPVSRKTGWRWIKAAQRTAELAGTIQQGKLIKTHTLRHSAARHWLASGVPINKVQLWLGHANLATTLIYLQVLPDAVGDMERVP